MENNKKHIVVAMSGGVDSTVAAALLLDEGRQVSGLTMRVWDTEPLADNQDPDHIRDARKVAADLGIPLHVVDLREEFRQQVVTPFCSEYFAGRTPNPCVLCNRVFKFRRLLQEADRLGADALATGHYARIVEDDHLRILAKGCNHHKDQSYFLFTLTQQQLQRVVFPLGEMSKDDVRAHAQRLGLHVAQKGDSQDICFIPDGDYIGFLERQSDAPSAEGSIVHVSGKVLGKHRGAYRFTIGQRRGLGIAWPEPLYVIAIDATKQQVVVGELEHLKVDQLVTTGTNWIVPAPQQPLRARCRIRYRHHEAPCTLVVLDDERVEVRFDEPQNGVTPGQAAVFYDGDRVLGGGLDCMKGTYAIVTLGCKTNQFESTAMAEQLEQAGFERVDYSNGAELVIVNTCTVTVATDSQSRNLIRRARRLNPSCRVVVTGCYAQVDPAALENLPGVDLVLGNEEKGELVRWLSTDGPKVRVGDIRQARGVTFDLNSFGSRSRAFVQIQNGCNAFCSYCIIPHARGPSRSALPGQILEQVAKFCAAGFPEIVLTGIHIGGYGNDLQPPSTLAALVHQLLAETEVRRLRLGSIEPLELSTELIELVAQSDRLCPHFHIPLQAGDDGILKAMNRHYSVDYFRRLVLGIDARLPDAAIGLDVITGFPGETEQAFANTLALIKELPVSHLHVFPFSRRPGTPAATMPQQVPGDVARGRAAQLRTLGETKQRTYAQRFVGRRLDVVVEGEKRHGWRNGLTVHYLPVTFPVPAGLDSRLVSVEILESGEEGLIGRLVD